MARTHSLARPRPGRRLRFESLEGRRLLALAPEMVVDLNLNGLGGRPRGFFAMGDSAYFMAEGERGEPFGGQRLWRTDGTPTGTVPIATLTGGVGSHFANPIFVPVGDALFYYTYAIDSQLWRSDGTAEGTVRVLGMTGRSPGPVAANHLTSVGDTLFFTSDSDGRGTELWKSDGTTAGTVRVKDINPGPDDSDPTRLTNVNGTLYFVALGGLWRSDGTETGTIRIANIPFEFGMMPRDLTPVGDVLYFVTEDSAGKELWMSDGTEAGTGRVKDILPGPGSSDPINLVGAGGLLYFSADDGVTGKELWRSDGTEGGTYLVKETREGPLGGVYGWKAYIDGALLFVASSLEDGSELWKSDGTPEGTLPLTHLDDFYVELIGNANDTLYMDVAVSGNGHQIWKTDGTEVGTVLVKDFEPSTAGGDYFSLRTLAEVQGKIVFAADHELSGTELWISDGTEAGTQLLKEFTTTNAGSGASVVMRLDESFIFLTASRLWKSDGSPAGTVRVTDRVGVELRNSRPSSVMKRIGRDIFFVGGNPTTGTEIWKTDGTDEGTLLVKDIRGPDNDPLGDTEIMSLTPVGETLYFVLNDGVHGPEIWKTDGTEAGTSLLKDIGHGNVRPTNLAAVGDLLYFVAYDDFLGWELWRSDGTEEGTRMVQDIWPGIGSSLPEMLTEVNGVLFFTATDEDHGRELWRLDQQGDIRRIAEFRSGRAGSELQFLVSINGVLYFNASQDGSSSMQLWRSDGTETGTYRLQDREFEFGVAAGDSLYFTVGGELWKSDGTEAGTALAWKGSAGTGIERVWNGNGTLFMRVAQPETGRELWRSDGTAEGTYLVTDLRPGPEGSFPNDLLAIDNVVYFGADDGQHGGELWKLASPPGDTDFDGDVDVDDLNNVRNHFGYLGDELPGDVTGDGVVGLDDLNEVRNHFGGAEGSPATHREFAGTVSTANDRSQPHAVDAVFAQWTMREWTPGLAAPRRRGLR